MFAPSPAVGWPAGKGLRSQFVLIRTMQITRYPLPMVAEEETQQCLWRARAGVKSPKGEMRQHQAPPPEVLWPRGTANCRIAGPQLSAHR